MRKTMNKTLATVMSAAMISSLVITPTTAVFADNYGPSEEVVALRNVSVMTYPNETPVLPTTVAGLDIIGRVQGQYDVVWGNINTDELVETGDYTEVLGSALVDGTEMPVTCMLRLGGEIYGARRNIAREVSSLEQDVPTANQSDVLSSIINNSFTFTDDTNERWSNYNNRFTDSTVTLTYTWDAVENIDLVGLYYYYDQVSAYPESLQILYSMNGTDYQAVEYTSTLKRTETLGQVYGYTFDTVKCTSMKLVFTQQDGVTGDHCIALIESMIYGYESYMSTPSDYAYLTALEIDGVEDTTFYEEDFSHPVEGDTIEVGSYNNAAVTVLPEYNNNICVVTLSESGDYSYTYNFGMLHPSHCSHENTTTENAVPAGCITAGYSGDVKCDDCGEYVSFGEVIPKLNHELELQNEVEETCTTNGYTGDYVCTECGCIVAYGNPIPAFGHFYDEGVVTVEMNAEHDGEIVYTCEVCEETKTEIIPRVLKDPTVSLAAKKGTSTRKVVLTATINDYANIDQYYSITEQGVVLITSSRLGSRVLTTNTAGVTNVKISSIGSTGNFGVTMTASTVATKYVARSYIKYVDNTGRTQVSYSNPLTFSYTTCTR